MLKWELLQFTRTGGRITPRFAVMDQNLTQHAEILLNIYREAWQKKLPRTYLEENLEPFLKNPAHGKRIAGFNKVILDHSEFAGNCSGIDAAGQRERIFKAAAEILKNPPEDPQQYRQAALSLLPENSSIPQDIYGDLPEFDILSRVPEWNAAALCNMYNIALVQGLLLYAESLELTLADTEPMAIRKFMRRLKFYRLLAEVHKISPYEVSLTLSGPAALFSENRKYGMQLAAFFQVILLFKEWKFRAVLKMREDSIKETLSLNSSRCQLKSSLRHWAACVPDEVALFVKTFRQCSGDWQEAPDAELPRIAGIGTFFPDFSFARKDEPEAVVHVELFHRYYTHDLEERLKFLQYNERFPLVIGIDRLLLGKEGEQDFIQRHRQMEKHAFFYSSYPGCERVRKMLDKVYAAAYK